MGYEEIRKAGQEIEGIAVNAEQHAGTGSREKRMVWAKWARLHQKELKFLNDTGLLSEPKGYWQESDSEEGKKFWPEGVSSNIVGEVHEIHRLAEKAKKKDIQERSETRENPGSPGTKVGQNLFELRASLHDRVMPGMSEQAQTLGSELAARVRWGNVIEHLLTVNSAAVFLAEKLKVAGAKIDLSVVDSASILHDAAKRQEIDSKIPYSKEEKAGLLGKFFKQSNFSDSIISAAHYSARVKDMVAPEPGKSLEDIIAARTLEQIVVGYVDARTRNDEIVSLEQALTGNCSKNPKDEVFYRNTWYPFYRVIEKRIFESLKKVNFRPEDLNNKAVFEMVKEKVTPADKKIQIKAK